MDKAQYEIMRRLEDSLWWYVGMRQISKALLPPLAANLRVLDAGCGTGATLDFLAPHGRVWGVDLAMEALQHCQARGHRSIAYASVERLPFPDDCFDLVTCFDVIYHKAVGDDVAVLGEFWRVLRPGGITMIRVPAYDWLRGAHDVAVHTRHRYTGGEVREKLTRAGFRVARVTHANCFLLPVAIVKRTLEGRRPVVAADLEHPGALANRVLAVSLALEARLVRWMNLPWGLSVFGIGIKPEKARKIG